MTDDVRAIEPDEAEAFLRAVYRAFGTDYPKETERELRRFRDTMPIEGTRAAFDGAEVVGTLGTAPLTLRTPGGSIEMAGTTMVTVQPSHRRRGLQRALMTSHLEGARAEGKPIAGLWSSEVPIYGRYGYGNANDRFVAEIDASAPSVLRGGIRGSVRLVDPQRAPDILPGIYHRATEQRPGTLVRSEAWWKWEILHDPEHFRRGNSTYRFAVREGDAGPDGYVMFRQKDVWTDLVADGRVMIEELVAADPEAHADLWRFITSIDLFPKVSYWNLPLDDELPWLTHDSRKVVRRQTDGLWLRILDVPAVLEARSYPVDGAIAIAVHDPLFPDLEGTYRLEVSGGEGRCRRVATEPELTLGVAALGSLFLGGQSAVTLARAGLVEGDEDAAVRADGLFSWPVAPWCPEIF